MSCFNNGYLLVCFIMMCNNGLYSKWTNLRKTKVDRNSFLTISLLDEQFTASSYRYQGAKNNFRPQFARLTNVLDNNDLNDDKAWCSQYKVHHIPTEWIQVDFRRMVALQHIYTKGRGSRLEFTPELLIKYQRYHGQEWKTYLDVNNKSVLSINNDSRNIMRLRLKTIVARKIRLYPLAASTSVSPVDTCLRFSLQGFDMKDEITSYTLPQGDSYPIRSGSPLPLVDELYDGVQLNPPSGQLIGGLGVLQDNLVWTDDYPAELSLDELMHPTKSAIHSNMIGWHCYPGRTNQNIRIDFKFSQEREFHSLELYGVAHTSPSIDMKLPATVYIYKDSLLASEPLPAAATGQGGGSGSGSDSGGGGGGGGVGGMISVNQSMISTVRGSMSLVVPLNNLRGWICSIQFACHHHNYWLMLTEVRIQSTQISSSSSHIDNAESTKPGNNNFSKLSTKPDYRVHSNYPINKQHNNNNYDIGNSGISTTTGTTSSTFLMVITIATVVLTLLLSCMLLLFYKLRRDRHRHKLHKKLQLVAHCKTSSDGCGLVGMLPSASHHSMIGGQGHTPTVNGNHHGGGGGVGNIFTIQSNSAGAAGHHRAMNQSQSSNLSSYTADSNLIGLQGGGGGGTSSNCYEDSHNVAAGVYASWPNTDDDTVPLSNAASGGVMTSSESYGAVSVRPGLGAATKEYATYQANTAVHHDNTHTAASVNMDYYSAPGLISQSVFRPEHHNNNNNDSYTVPSSIIKYQPSTSLHSQLNSTGSFYPIITSANPITQAMPLSNTQQLRFTCNNSNLTNVLDYRGSCGEVDFRYYNTPTYSDIDKDIHVPQHHHSNKSSNSSSDLDTNIKVIPASLLTTQKLLTTGSYGHVEVCRLSGTGNQSNYLIVKTLNKDAPTSHRANFIRELRILSGVRCDNLVQFHSLALDQPDSSSSELANQTLRIVLLGAQYSTDKSYANGNPTGTEERGGNSGSYNLRLFLLNCQMDTHSMHCRNPLDKFRNGLVTFYDQVGICVQVSNAVLHLHEMRVAHRDLGPHNCTIDPRTGLVKLYPGGIVFDQDSDIDQSIPHTAVYTKMGPKHLVPLRYMAPETIANGEVSAQTEVWSLGLCLWEIMRGCQYPLMDPGSLPAAVSQPSHPMHYRINQIINDCTLMPTETRLSISQVHSALRHMHHTLSTNNNTTNQHLPSHQPHLKLINLPGPPQFDPPVDTQPSQHTSQQYHQSSLHCNSSSTISSHLL